jgi:hypothetical protein
MHIVDGVPTLAGWLDFLQILVLLGVFGAIAGIIFWSILRTRMQRQVSSTVRGDAQLDAPSGSPRR